MNALNNTFLRVGAHHRESHRLTWKWAGVVEHCECQTAIQEYPDGHGTTVLALEGTPSMSAMAWFQQLTTG